MDSTNQKSIILYIYLLKQPQQDHTLYQMPRSSVSHSNSPPRRQVRNLSPERNDSPKRRSPTRHSSQQENSGQPKVYVSGLSSNAKKEDLQQKFSKYGSIQDLFVVNKEDFSFAFVLYSEHSEAQAAIDELSGTEIQGKKVRCQFAKPRAPRGQNEGGRGGRGNGGNRGGSRNDGGNRPKGCFKCQEEGHFARECPNPSQGNNDRGNDRGGRGFNENRNKRQDYQRAESPIKRPQRKRSRSNSIASPQKKKQTPRSPVKRGRSPSSSGSIPKNKQRRSRSRSSQLRKGKKKVSHSSSSR